jgi:hypothetical protein
VKKFDNKSENNCSKCGEEGKCFKQNANTGNNCGIRNRGLYLFGNC